GRIDEVRAPTAFGFFADERALPARPTLRQRRFPHETDRADSRGAAGPRPGATSGNMTETARPKRKLTAIAACYKDEQAIPFMAERLQKTFAKIDVDY